MPDEIEYTRRVEHDGLSILLPTDFGGQATESMHRYVNAWQFGRYTGGLANPTLASAQFNQLVAIAYNIASGKLDPFPHLPVTKDGRWPANIRRIVLARADGDVIPLPCRTRRMCLQLRLDDAYATKRDYVEDMPIQGAKALVLAFAPSRGIRPVLDLDGNPIRY